MKQRKKYSWLPSLLAAIMVVGMGTAWAENKVLEEPGVICAGGLKGTRFTEKDTAGKVLQIQCVPDNSDGTPVMELSPEQKAYVVKEQSSDCPAGQRGVWYKGGVAVQKPGNDVDPTAAGYTYKCENIPVPPRTLSTETDRALLERLPFRTSDWDERNGGWQVGAGIDLLFTAYCGNNNNGLALCPASTSRYYVSVHYLLTGRWSMMALVGAKLNNVVGALDPAFYGALLVRAKIGHSLNNHLVFGPYVEAAGAQRGLNMGLNRGPGVTDSNTTVGLSTAVEYAPYKRTAVFGGINLGVYNTGNQQTKKTLALPDWGKPTVFATVGTRFYFL